MGEQTTAEAANEWYKDAVVYSVDVETFQDSDGDGIGDFRGLIDRLDYLDGLGVDCLWLLPFYPTPNRDNGYDVKDHYGVDPRLGDLGDLVAFVDAANARGIRVIADLVVNHTSVQHPWFQEARQDPDSKYRDYYLWTDDPESAPEKGTVFPGEEEDVWTYDEEADLHYYHRFYHFQPDLNIANPDVREEIRKIVSFWIQLGLDGFRIDAATLMVDQKGAQPQVIDDPHQVFREMKRAARARNPDAAFLAEADDEPPRLRDYFGEGGDEMDMLLNFVLNAHVAHSLATGTSDALYRGIDVLPDLPEHGRWGNFVRNFDEFNLGKLSPGQIDEVYEAFAPEESMRIYNRGIRRRLAPMLDGDRNRLELAYSLLFSLSGVPVLVSGDEIGMGEDLSLQGRNPVRLPMHWTDGANAGFSSADADELVRPVVSDGPFSYEDVNVADQRADPNSLLNRVSRLIQTRKEAPAFSRGDHRSVDVADDRAFAHVYRLDGNGILAVHNLSEESVSVSVDVDVDPDEAFRLAGPAEFDATDDGCNVSLDGYGYCWVRTHGARQRRPPMAADD